MAPDSSTLNGGKMVTLKIKPLTFNSAYPTNRQGRRFLSNEGKRYKQEITRASLGAFPVPESGPLLFIYEVHGPFLTKKGEISKTAGDLDGFAKLLLDAVCEASGCDDSRVFEIQARKLVSLDWAVKFGLFAL